MNRSRRDFLRTAGGVAIAGLGGSFPAFERAVSAVGSVDRPVSRIAVLFEPGFPGVDDFTLTREALTSETEGLAVELLGVADLPSKLAVGRFDLFVNPYGSAFPAECWTAIRAFLSDGGSLLNLGGVPFSIPVRREGTLWTTEVFQTSYYKSLGITETFAVDLSPGTVLREIPGKVMDPGIAGAISADRVHEFYVKFTSTRDYPQEDGTSGQRDATIDAIVGAYAVSGDLVAAPVVVIDRHLGEFAGGRWVFAAFDGLLAREGLRRLIRLALPAPLTVSVEPTFATYFPGEVPAFRLSARTHNRAAESGPPSTAWQDGDEWKLTITGPGGYSHGESLSGRALRKARAYAWVLPSSAGRLRPGFYTVGAEFRPATRPAETVVCRNGFWVHDAGLLASGDPLVVRDNSFYRDGEPFPVTGTSYMSEGVQRKFLLEPNPWLWDRDFREMKEAGINLVRTGIWTGWKNVMLDAGTVSEHPLRSLDAFILTAQRHGIPVIFTFFAFLPETWGGTNPYLDPRSLDAQKVFLATIARRYRDCPGVAWDLINEPSFCSPSQLWYCRPNYDRFEKEAWKEWVIAGAPASDEASSLSIVRERWRLTEGEPASLPPLEEFRDVNLVGSGRLLRVGDYRLFAQEMFRRWTAELAAVLREAGGPGQLVTVGQDEGGTYERPGPHFFSEHVDFTSMHNWWYNDDLLWDSLVTTVHGKPNLIEETGVMFYEKADGRPWRSEQETRNLLERKLAIAFGAGGAGFVNWLWNTNQYMDSDNEAGIGLKRPDGSLKPEFDVVRQYGKFFAANRRWLGESEPAETVMVIPHGTMFSTRDSASEATRTAVRAAEYHAGIPLRTVSEFSLDRIGPAPKLIVFPAPATIDSAAWDKLASLVRGGSTLLVSGPLDHDRYLMPAGRSSSLGVDGGIVTVRADEHLVIDGSEFRVGFRGGKIQRIEKFVIAGAPRAEVRVIPLGAGSVIWSPIPVESGDSIEAVSALYRFAAKKAGVTDPLAIGSRDPSVLARPVFFRAAVMVVFVSDASETRTLAGALNGGATPFTVAVPPGRTVVRIHGRPDGRTIAELNPSLTEAF